MDGFLDGVGSASARAARVAPVSIERDGRAVEAACADHDLVVARVADHRPSDVRIVSEEGLGAGEAARVLVAVEKDGESALELVGDGDQLGGQVGEDRDGHLRVGGAAPVELASFNVTGRWRVVPGALIAEGRRVQARVQTVRRLLTRAFDHGQDRNGRAISVKDRRRHGVVIQPSAGRRDGRLRRILAGAAGNLNKRAG